jgi:mono/diheme cytochrome c family protein/uncharacterized membrane protein
VLFAHLLVLMLLAQTLRADQPARAAPTPASLASAAAAAFAAKCTQCHGETLAHPKAHFGLMPNLRKLAADADHLVPGHPEDSDLWKEIDGGDMPPDEAKAGPLTDAERDAILAWIKAGAPVPEQQAMPASAEAGRSAPTPPATSAPPAQLAPQTLPPPAATDTEPQSLLSRAVLLLGRTHVILVHFPIALLIAAAGVESRCTLQGRRTCSPTVRFCIATGAAAAIVSAALGWIHALDGFPGPFSHPLSLANTHRWLGTLAALVACSTLALSEHDSRRGTRSNLTRLAILASAAIVGTAGHFGGLLTHGRDFLTP